MAGLWVLHETEEAIVIGFSVIGEAKIEDGEGKDKG